MAGAARGLILLGGFLGLLVALADVLVGALAADAYRKPPYDRVVGAYALVLYAETDDAGTAIALTGAPWHRRLLAESRGGLRVDRAPGVRIEGTTFQGTAP